MDYNEHIFLETKNHTVDFEDADIAQDITFILVGLLGIPANILTIYIICYFRKLHTDTNIYLINWAIASIGSVLISISYFAIFFPHYDVSDELLNFYYALELGLTFNMVLFMLIISVNWCMYAYFPTTLDNFRKFTQLILACVWIFTVFVTAFVVSWEDYYYVFHYAFLFTCSVFIILVLMFLYIRLVQRCRGKFQYHSVSPLLIPTIFGLCWVLSWVNLLILEITEEDIVPMYVYWFTDFPTYLHPTLNFFLLLVVDQDFRASFSQLFKCGMKEGLVGQDLTNES